ncbi:MAG: energy transducer TonB [Flavobacteriales bacterium]|nr:energy transducer TonB [Flavobacteriales bacterium]
MRVQVFRVVGVVAALALALGTSAQQPTDVIEGWTLQERPEYPGGQDSLYSFLAKNVQYPDTSKIHGAQGRVLVEFIVEPDGMVTGVRVLKGVHPLLDAEAVRVVGLLPRWSPGKVDGKAIRAKFTLPIRFN